MGWLLVTDAEARHLVAGRVPAKVRQMAAQLLETLEQTLERKGRERDKGRRLNQRAENDPASHAGRTRAPET